MTRYLSRRQVEDLHQKALAAHGGDPGFCNESGLESAVAQPQMTFGGQCLYPTLHDKACALAFSLIMNHPFLDGNKRVAHLAMVVFLMANGYELSGDIDEHEKTVFAVASSEMPRDQFADWIRDHLIRSS
jgi:death-on-curing protein